MSVVSELVVKNQARWEAMHIKADRIAGFDATAKRLCASKVRYQIISVTTSVPWFVIAVIHEREASGNFNCQLGQGDPLDEVSRHDPTGRGPFLNHSTDPPGHDAFYRGAVDALENCAPKAALWKDWTAGGTCTVLEEYNGLGYAQRGVPSAYVWSGSDQYVSGKYVADHVYRASAVDVQEGCAPLISRMMAVDVTISFAPSANAPAAGIMKVPVLPSPIPIAGVTTAMPTASGDIRVDQTLPPAAVATDEPSPARAVLDQIKALLERI